MSESTKIPSVFYTNIEDQVIFGEIGPKPQFLVDSEQMKVILAGLEPGQQIPAHPESLAMYHFLSGSGVMEVNGERFVVGPGATVITPPNATRGMKAETRLVFLAAKPG